MGPARFRLWMGSDLDRSGRVSPHHPTTPRRLEHTGVRGLSCAPARTLPRPPHCLRIRTSPKRFHGPREPLPRSDVRPEGGRHAQGHLVLAPGAGDRVPGTETSRCREGDRVTAAGAGALQGLNGDPLAPAPPPHEQADTERPDRPRHMRWKKKHHRRHGRSSEPVPQCASHPPPVRSPKENEVRRSRFFAEHVERALDPFAHGRLRPAWVVLRIGIHRVLPGEVLGCGQRGLARRRNQHPDEKINPFRRAFTPTGGETAGARDWESRPRSSDSPVFRGPPARSARS
jgi:hypothetical protein